jgi:pyruvate dehydrogenase E1 component beta subunit
VDFALLAVDQIVNQAAKWSAMFGGKAHVPVTFRCIVNRGGQQGAQHSQSLHSWFAHVPGLRVVMPSSPTDARDLLVASVLSDDPVIFMDDRWLYELEEEVAPIVELDLAAEGPVIRREGTDVTLVGAGHAALLCLRAADTLALRGVACEVIDVRVPGPLDPRVIVSSVGRTGRLLAVDGDWSPCGLAAELIAVVTESLDLQWWRARPTRMTLPAAPAPTSAALEDVYYPTASQLGAAVMQLVSQ